jgi:hypothetical protein
MARTQARNRTRAHIESAARTNVCEGCARIRVCTDACEVACEVLVVLVMLDVQSP